MFLHTANLRLQPILFGCSDAEEEVNTRKTRKTFNAARSHIWTHVNSQFVSLTQSYLPFGYTDMTSKKAYL